MRTHSLARIVAFALPLGLSACPAFLSDDFRIVSDAGANEGGNEIETSDATPADALSDGLGVGIPDVVAETLGDTGTDATVDGVSVANTAVPEASIETAAEADVGAEAAAVDTPAESSVEAGTSTCTAITPIVAAIGACGGSYTTGLQIAIPSTYCQYVTGSLMPIEFGDSWAAVPTPTACQCVETYTCACILANVPQATLCPPGTSYNTCSAPMPPGAYGQNGLWLDCKPSTG